LDVLSSLRRFFPMRRPRTSSFLLPITSLMVFLFIQSGCRPDRELLLKTHAGPSAEATGAEGVKDSPVVARIGDRSIMFEEVSSNLDALPMFVRMRYQAPERRLEFLEAYIEYQLLALDASRRGMAGDSLVVDELKHDLVDRYLRENVDAAFRSADVSREDLERVYNQNLDRFNRPAQKRVLRIVVADRLEAARLAFRAAELTRQASGDPVEVFRGLAKPPLAPPGVAMKLEDLGFLHEGSPAAAGLPEPVVLSAMMLGELYSVGGPVEAPDGWSVLFLAEERPAVAIPFEQASSDVAGMIVDERRLEARRALAASLRAGREVTVDADVLSGLAAEASSLAAIPAGEVVR